MLERSPLGQQLFEVVARYMGMRGDLGDVLTVQESWLVYCQADGFGKCSPAELRRINGGWDWSHVRDSSEAGIAAMYAQLLALLAAKGLEVGQAA